MRNVRWGVPQEPPLLADASSNGDKSGVRVGGSRLFFLPPVVAAGGADATVTGVRALATATAQPGTVSITATGVRASAAATGVGYYSAEVLADSPYLYWHLGEQSATAADASGNNRTGTYNGTPATAASCLRSYGNNSTLFDSFDDYLLSDFLLNTSLVTVEVWFDYDGIAPGAGAYWHVAGFSQGDAINTNDKNIIIDDQGRARFYAYDGGLEYAVGTVLTAGIHHLAGTYDGSNLRIYIDGAEAGIVAAVSTYAGYSGNNIMVGGATAGNPFGRKAGRRDEFAVYTTALSPERILAHYIAGTRQAGSPLVTATGVRATATATAQPGTVQIVSSVTVVGVQASATATGRAGEVLVSLLGTQAAAAATAQPGTPLVVATGERAVATATAQPGTVQLVTSVTIVGVQASATATAQAGSPIVTATGARAASTATAQPGTPLVVATGVRALATATAQPGSVLITGDIVVVGARAVATATAQAGSPVVTLPGSRALATATATVGGVLLAVGGVRATATATAQPGTFSLSSGVIGGRALATATAQPGTVVISGAAAVPELANRTVSLELTDGLTLVMSAGGRVKVATGGGSSIVTGNSRTRVLVGSGKTNA